MEGWIKLHRKLLDWEWYDEPNTLRLFIHLILVSTHKPKKWRGIDLMPGESFHSLDKLAKDLKLTKDQIRTGILHLLQTKEITQRRHGKLRIIQIVNYYDYQLNPTKIPRKSHDDPTMIPSNKNDKNNSLKKDVQSNLLDFENIFLSFFSNPDASKITEQQKTNRFNKISAFFESQKIWRETLCMKFGIEENRMINYQIKFINHIEKSDSHILKSIHDLQNYFTNWLAKNRV